MLSGMNGLDGFSPMQGSLQGLGKSPAGSVGLGKMRFGNADETDEATKSPNAGNVLNNFSNALKDQMQHISDLDAASNEAKQTYAVGGDIQLHDVMIASEKADLSLQLAMQIRNKAVSAYQEISRMSV
jgi:flagellar hook-basal body complex protein FliE